MNKTKIKHVKSDKIDCFASDFGLVPEEKADQGVLGGRHGVSVPDCSQTCEAEHAWLG